MLLGYKKETGEIEFLFTDENYLAKRFPNNSAKISDFWNNNDHGLTELFISIKEFPIHNDYKLYKVINNQIIKKSSEEIQNELNQLKIRKESKIIPNTEDNVLNADKIRIKELEEKIRQLENTNKNLESSTETRVSEETSTEEQI
jgi:hypothetical protein